jgi:hypothetical protein
MHRGGSIEVNTMPTLTDSQTEMLRVIASPLPFGLRRRFLERLDDILRDRIEIGDGQLWHAAHAIAKQLVNEPRPGAPCALGSAEGAEIMRGIAATSVIGGS